MNYLALTITSHIGGTEEPQIKLCLGPHKGLAQPPVHTHTHTHPPIVYTSLNGPVYSFALDLLLIVSQSYCLRKLTGWLFIKTRDAPILIFHDPYRLTANGLILIPIAYFYLFLFKQEKRKKERKSTCTSCLFALLQADLALNKIRPV